MNPSQYLPKPILRVCKRANNVFTRIVTGVLVGKFVGDYAAILMTAHLGTHQGYQFGIAVFVTLAIVGKDLIRAADRIEDELDEFEDQIRDE